MNNFTKLNKQKINEDNFLKSGAYMTPQAGFMSLEECANRCQNGIDIGDETQCKFFSHSTNSFTYKKTKIPKNKCLLFNFKLNQNLDNITEEEKIDVFNNNTVLYKRKDEKLN